MQSFSIEIAKERGGKQKTRWPSKSNCLNITDFSVCFCPKIQQSSADGIVKFPNGDFVAVFGSFSFDGEFGDAALRAFYESYTGNPEFNRMAGSFSILVLKKGKLHAFTDENGIQSLFTNRDCTFLSTSFLAVAETLPSVTLNLQSAYEYVLYGAVYGDATLAEEIRELDSSTVHQLWPEKRSFPKTKSTFPGTPRNGSLKDWTEYFRPKLIDYFSVLADAGGRACSALSGGYDSRLILALMRKVGLPFHLYVYGSADSPDVRVARAICEGEGLELSQRNKAKIRREINPDFFEEAFHRHYYLADGRGIFGAIDDGTDFITRRERTEGVRFQLNGGGGRNFPEFLEDAGSADVSQGLRPAGFRP